MLQNKNSQAANLNTAAACFDWNYKNQFHTTPDQDAKALSPEGLKIQAITHGVVMERKEDAATVLKPNNQHKLLQERIVNREKAYHRTEHQELGRSRKTHVDLPLFTSNQAFRFGDATVLGEGVGKIMYPLELPKQDQKPFKNYIISNPSSTGTQKLYYGPSWTRPKSPQLTTETDLDNRVSTALFWEKNADQFKSVPQADISQIIDPYHILINFRVTNQSPHLNPDYTIYELMGNNPPSKNKSGEPKLKFWKLAPAGKKTTKCDDLDLQKTIIPKLHDLEDHKLVLKITEDKLGGTVLFKNHFGQLNRVFGLKSVRDPSERIGKVKGLADQTSYGDELGAKGLIYPTAANTYGKEQLKMYYMQKMEALKVVCTEVRDEKIILEESLSKLLIEIEKLQNNLPVEEPDESRSEYLIRTGRLINDDDLMPNQDPSKDVFLRDAQGLQHNRLHSIPVFE